MAQNFPLLPLRDLVIFPHMMMPLFVGREKSINALEEAINKQTDIVLVAQKDPKTNTPDSNNLFSIGTVGSIIQLLRLPDGTVKALIEGKRRVRVLKHVASRPCFIVEVEELKDEPHSAVEIQALVRSVKASFENYVRLNKRIPPENLMRVTAIESVIELSDVIAGQLNLKLEDKQKILEATHPARRLEQLLNLMSGEIEILEVERKIRGRVKKQMERSQKEYYLNEQMQAIQKELGERDGFQSEVHELEHRLKDKKLSAEALKKIKKELRKLKSMSPMSAETTVVRNYIDWVLELPWNKYVKDKNDIQVAKKILDDDHWGLKKVKDRILEHLAVQYLTDAIKGPVLCLVGPPGVGKTSLARSVARALNRPFTRISLGGVRDEAEIRGHRKTYVGAMPGKIIQAMKKCEYGNPLVLLDEVDKMSTDFRGDPSSALLEVLDPEQNKHFQDHYLEVDYDLSKVLFFTTANSLHTVPRPLKDRMEVIQIEGYIEDEKFHIAKKYLIPKQIKNHGLEPYKILFADAAVREIIRSYTKEAGVRGLERQIGSICRKLAKSIVAQKNSEQADRAAKTTGSKTTSSKTTRSNKAASKATGKTATDQKGQPPTADKTKIEAGFCVRTKQVNEFLGHDKHKYGKIEGQSEVGLTNGLAWTEVGGDLLAVEVSVVPGKSKLIITGQLGDVMKESCSAAMSYVRSRGPLFGLEKEFYETHDVHIHLPEGAIPKDGPSAGIAVVTSIVSAMMRVPVNKTVAMTGEVTLRGRVLPIGGLKEKILAAHRGGIKTVICPKRNEKDLKDVPASVTNDVQLILVDHVDQVLVNALEIKNAKELFKTKTQKTMKLRAQYTGHQAHLQ